MKDNMRVQNEYRSAIETLKRALKKQGLSYRDLAKEIGLSESGVKKIFSAQDGSFQRLAQMCRYLGISLSEIIEDHRTFKVNFSEEQQKAFLNDPLLFQVYWLLSYERRSLEQTKMDLKLDNKKVFSLARKLDQINLLKLLPEGRLRLPSIKAVRWIGDGLFVRKIYEKWALALTRDLAKPEVGKDEVFLLRYLPMTKTTYREFTKALFDLEAEFMRRSIREMKAYPEEVEHVRWLVAADNRSYVTGLKSQT